ncbi:class II aldolase/adducin N-terminal [Aspergillus falconensis]
MAPSFSHQALTHDVMQNKKETALEKHPQGTPLPRVPMFTDIELQRHHILNHMALMSGHISLRDPEFPDRFWTKSLGLHLGIINPSDMILVDETGVAVGGNRTRPANAAGFVIHAALHTSQLDVNAACHFHSTYGKVWSAFARPLEMLN